MSTAVFPTLIGLGFDVVRRPVWSNGNQVSVSGKKVGIAFWSYPRWQWELTYEILRGDSTNHEFQDLAAFFNTRQGSFDTFLYQDADDNSVTSQQIGIGDGSMLTFQLIRSMSGFSEPIFGPHTVSTVYVDGVDQAGHWTVSNWGTATPGVITFAGGHAPANAKAVTADFTYYFPCRFTDDQLDFNKFMAQMWAAKSVKFESEK